MTELFLALGAFLVLHSVPALPPVRAGAVAMLGRRTYLGLYSAVSVVVLAWLFHAALNSDYVELWAPAAWQARVTILISPIALFLVLAGLAGDNPLSINARGGEHPAAITSITRHPVLIGFTLWSFAHLLANGDLRSLVLFGGLGLFSLAGIPLLDRRARRRLGPAWRAMAWRSETLPFAAILGGRARLRIDRSMALALALAGALTAWLLMGGHAGLFGADPLLAAAG